MVGRRFGRDSIELRRLQLVLLLAAARAAAADDPIEVEIRGQPTAPPKDPSVAGSVIREERLRAPGQKAADVLRTQPGVAVMDTGGFGSISTASVRGATAAQTPVYLAGVRLNDDAGGTADLSLVPLWMIHQVEIYRSHAPLAGDELGIGGAIFFEPRRPRKSEVGAGAMAGSFGARALWARAGAGDDARAALVGVRLEGARNDYTFVNDGGTRFNLSRSRTVSNINADSSTIDTWAIGNLSPGGSATVDFVANDLEREQGLPGLTLFPSTAARLRRSRRLAGISTRIPTRDEAVVIGTTTAALLTHARYDDPLYESGLNTTKIEVDATRVENALSVQWALSDRLSLSPSARASVERMRIAAAGSVPLHVQRVHSRAALQAEWSITDSIKVRGLGSADCHGTSLNGTPPFSQLGDSAGPVHGSALCNQPIAAFRGGIEVGHAPLTFLVNAGRYARVPTLTELYGLSGVVRGNSALVPETGVAIEAGVRASASATSPLHGAFIDVFGFVRWADDLVAYQRASIGYVRPFNLGSARVAGLEWMATYRPVPFASFELAATLLDPRNTTPIRPANDILPYQPQLTLVPSVETSSKLGLLPFDEGKLKIMYFYQSSHYGDPAGLLVIPEQGSLDAEVELSGFASHLALRARFSNLLDQTRFDLIGYPLPGRAAYAEMEARW